MAIPDGAQTAPARPSVIPLGGNTNPSASRSPPRLTSHTSRSGSRSLSLASKTLLRNMDSFQGVAKPRRKLGIQDELRQQADGVVKRRSGGVLGRGYILKTDHYPTGRALDLDIEIQGAPNFRVPDQDECNIFGVAQPTVPGLKSILTILRCQPTPMPTKSSSRRSSSTVVNRGGVKMGPPLSKNVSQSAVSLDSNEGDERGEEEGKAVWFSTREETLVYCNGRPYVLRDASVPFQTLTLSNRAPNLEDIERRLKQDILEEARRYGGMILFHDELENGQLVPTWMSVDETSIRTPREVWENEKAKGWRVEYHRIPIAPDTPIEDNYLDAYVSVLKNVDPQNTALVFNCGMGVVRTTFAMVAASLMRRQQLLMRGFEDPFAQDIMPSGISTPNGAIVDQQATQSLELANQQQALNKSLLQMTRILDRNLPSRHGNAVDLLTQHPTLLEQLRKAHMGSYQIVLALISSLDGGRQIKALVDEIIDSCDAVVNLREHVLEYRIKYSVAAMDDKARQGLLEKASRSLEQYFDLIVFAAYVAEEDAGSTGVTFSAWLQHRPEIWKYVSTASPASTPPMTPVISPGTHMFPASLNDSLRVCGLIKADQDSQIKIIRRQGGNRLFAFAPANDLSLISRSSDAADGRDGGYGYGSRGKDGGSDAQGVQGAQILGDEWAEHVVTNRAGIMLRASTLLKSDQWLVEIASSAEGVRGAIGFRQIPGSSVFTTGQPTQDAARTILSKIEEKCPSINKVVWVCLREEPLCLINGWPYCLRRDGTALRNMRDYTGVSAGRLEMLEDRLKSDVVSELQQFQGKLLLHTETSDGQVVPVWESVDKDDVESVKEMMDELAEQTSVDLSFYRVPITSESSPDFHDITELLDLCMHTDIDRTAFVLNDQLGRGRSSTTAVMILLIQRWMRRDAMRQSTSMPNSIHMPTTPITPTRDRSRHGIPRKMTSLSSPSISALAQMPSPATAGGKGDKWDLGAPAMGTGQAKGQYRATWQIINSCLRVIKNGTDVKRVVDEAIDASAAQFNLRDTIQDFQSRAEETKDEAKKNEYIEKGIYHLRRYFHLLIFQAYLNDRDPEEDDPYSFESFVKHRPVFKTLETELEEGGLAGLAPLDRLEVADGMALPDEVTQVVANRSGVILSAQTILKSDFFSGLQKQSLPERVDGAANYRKVVMPGVANSGHGRDYVYGTGMPSGPGLRNALHQMNAAPGGERRITWTSLREEPVIYVKARPHVLRLMDKPVTNIETTGVTAAVVERMENALKQDILNEIRRGDGRLLLHDEVENKPGQFEIIPIWETLDARDIMTPRELYDEVIKEGYQVDYLRVAITDEQAPLPASLQVILKRVVQGLRQDKDFVFNCQMGRGRTTTGMCVAALIAAIEHGIADGPEDPDDEDEEDEDGDLNQDEAQYLNGEYKTILQLVTVLTHGKQAKRITDQVIDSMEGVQNLRKAVYDFKLKADAASAGSSKQKAAMHQGVNYLYRYGTLIVLANFLLENRQDGVPLDDTDFPAWMQKHREIRSVLSRRELD